MDKILLSKNIAFVRLFCRQLLEALAVDNS